MDFELSEEQRLLKDSVERLTTQRYDFEARKKYMQETDGWSRALWKQYAELGLTALPFAEEHGGIGGGPVETMIVMEAFGRALALEPYFATVVLGGGFLRLGASDAAQRANCCRRSRPARRCSPSRISSGRRATISPTWRRPRRRTAPATCSTARRASCCTATSPTSSSSRRASRAAQRDQERHRAVSGRREGAGRVAPRLSDRWTACAPPKSRSRTSRSAPTP